MNNNKLHKDSMNFRGPQAGYATKYQTCLRIKIKTCLLTLSKIILGNTCYSVLSEGKKTILAHTFVICLS